MKFDCEARKFSCQNRILSLAFRTVASSFIAADQGIQANLFENLVNNFLFPIPDACLDALEPIFGKRHRWELISTAFKALAW